MRCYMFAVCGGVSIDQGTNNISLFELAEGVQIVPQLVNTLGPDSPILSLQSIACFSVNDAEVGRDFQMRLVWVRDDGSELPTSPQSMQANGSQLRIRALGMKGPPSLGRFELRIEWRWAGEDRWVREPVGWPLAITTAQAPPDVGMPGR